MANKNLSILLCLFLIACGSSEDSDNNRALGNSYDVILSDGLRVRYSDPKNIQADVLSNLYHQVEACIGATAPAPLVIYIDSVDEHCKGGYHPNACVFLSSGTILVENSISDSPWPFVHETVHWITHWNGALTEQQQSDHDSALFLDCATPGPITVTSLESYI